MTTQDAKLMATFLFKKFTFLDKNTYSETSYVELPDNNQCSYTSNQISYNTITLAQNFIVFYLLVFFLFHSKLKVQRLLHLLVTVLHLSNVFYN